MKKLVAWMIAGWLGMAAFASAEPLQTAFVYQGQLKQGGAPAAGVFDFQFTLLEEDGVTQVGRTCAFDVEVSNGLFTAELDFGAEAFNGDARLLQVGVRTAAGGIHDCTPNTIEFLFDLLSPLQPISPTPYALQTRGLFVDDAGNVGVGTQTPTAKLDIALAANGPTMQVPGTLIVGRSTLSGNDYPFVGIGRSTPLVGTDALAIEIPTTESSPFGGMYIIANSAHGLPFYGYATGGGFGWTYVSGFDGAWRLNVGGSDWMTVTSQGKFALGAGFTNSTNTLSVFGNADVQGNLGLGTGTPTNRLSVIGSANISGNLGVGTATPERRLQVVGGTDITPGGAGGSLVLGATTTANLLLDENEIQSMNNGAVVALSLNALGGNVGVGMTGPTEALHVNGNVRSDGVTGFNTRNPNNLGGQLILGWLNDVARVRIGGSDPGGTNGLDIQTTSDRSLMRLLHNGNVGINTTTPETLLHLFKGDAGMASNAANTLLTIEDDAPHFIRMMVPDATETGILFGNPTNGGTAAGVIFDGTVPNGLQLRTGTNDTRMVIDSSGRIGIGTTAPTVKTEIVANGTALRLTSANDNLPFLDLKSGTSTFPAAGGIRFLASDNAVQWSLHADSFGDFTIGGRFGDIVNISTSSSDRVSIGNNATLDVQASDPAFDGVINVTRQFPGRLIRFSDADNANPAIISEIGNITYSGSTVSYNAFTGSHYAWSAESFEEGMLVSMTGENRYASADAAGEPIYGAAKSSKPNDAAVLGAYFQKLDLCGASDTHLVSSVGNGDLCVVDRGGGDIVPGDSLISSDVAGCAMKDDPARFAVGHVIAKAADRIKWSEVQPDESGVRRKISSVLFGAFERVGSRETVAEVDRLRADLERKSAELEEVKMRLSHLEAMLSHTSSAKP